MTVDDPPGVGLINDVADFAVNGYNIETRSLFLTTTGGSPAHSRSSFCLMMFRAKRWETVKSNPQNVSVARGGQQKRRGGKKAFLPIKSQIVATILLPLFFY